MFKFLLVLLLAMLAIGAAKPDAWDVKRIPDLNWKKIVTMHLASWLEESKSSKPEIFSRMNEVCMFQLFTLANDLPSQDPKVNNWARQVVDSFGKPNSGLLDGSYLWLGEFEECTAVQNDMWNSKYCLVRAQVAPERLIRSGMCLPKACTAEDIATIVNIGLTKAQIEIEKYASAYGFMYNFTLPQVNASSIICRGKPEMDAGTIVSLVIIGILVALVLFASIYDIYKRNEIFLRSLTFKTAFGSLLVQEKESLSFEMLEHDEEIRRHFSANGDTRRDSLIQKQTESTFSQVILSFSAYTNTIKLFTVNKQPGQLDCLNAIRALSIAWVVTGHSYYFMLNISDNPSMYFKWLSRLTFLVISNSFFSVDTFFLLSGLLTSYLFMKEYKKTKKLSAALFIKYYVHRLWRITPPTMLIIMFTTNLSKFLGGEKAGPLFPDQDGFDPNCKNNWWTNLLYINNFVKSEKACLGVTWYLANDMQFHWLAPTILIPLALNKKLISAIVLGFYLLVNVLTTVLILNLYPGSEYGSIRPANVPPSNVFFQKVYIKPYSRVAPFIIGIIFGYGLFKLDIGKRNLKLNYKWNLIFWLIALVLMGLTVFGLHPNYLDNKREHLGVALNIIYQTSSRIIWSLCVSYVIFACLTKNGGVVNKILTWSIWVPLARLSFCTYLIHSVVLNYFNLTQERPIHFQDITMVVYSIANYAFSNVAALFASLLFEIPLIGLEKIFLH